MMWWADTEGFRKEMWIDLDALGHWVTDGDGCNNDYVFKRRMIRMQ